MKTKIPSYVSKPT